MLDVKAGLRAGFEALDEELKPRLSGYDYDFAGHGYFLAAATIAVEFEEGLVNAVRRSGEIFSSPILSAFSAICWKASAIISLAPPPFLPSIINVFQSSVRRGFRVSVS